MIDLEYKKILSKVLIFFFVVLSVLIIVKIFSEKENHFGKDDTEHTISFSGHGEVTAVPDIANISFNIHKEGKTAKEAQDKVAKVEKSVLAFLKENKIEDKDIKTTSFTFYPKYEYRYDTKIMMPCSQFSCPPQTGHNVIVGYEANENISLKVRNIDDAGKIISGFSSLEVSDLYGPNFTIDKEDDLKAEARKKAILDAKEKAKVLAKDLGIRLVDIVSFSEGDNIYPVMYSADAMMMKSGGEAVSAPAVLPKGENTITSNVTIVYEIE